MKTILGLLISGVWALGIITLLGRLLWRGFRVIKSSAQLEDVLRANGWNIPIRKRIWSNWRAFVGDEVLREQIEIQTAIQKHEYQLRLWMRSAIDIFIFVTFMVSVALAFAATSMFG